MNTTIPTTSKMMTTTSKLSNKGDESQSLIRKRRTDDGFGFFSRLALKRQTSNNKKTNNNKPSVMKKVSKNPYNYDACHMVAHFHRDEIVTGATLTLDSPHFEFYDVCGIQLHEHTDATDVTTDFSTSHDHDHDDVAVHHRQFPPLPVVAVDEDEARQVIQSQVKVTTGHKSRSNKPLHKYMIKQVHAKQLHQDHAVAHIVHEINLWKKLSHQHYNLLTLRGATFGGEHIFASQWDSYFLLTDRISETLGQRLQGWKDTPRRTLWSKKPAEPNSKKHVPVDAGSLLFRLKLVCAQNLANVLAFLHTKHIAVRNLHPDSIGFLASDDTLQLMDLGQAVEGIPGDKPQTAHQEAAPPATMLLQQQREHSLFLMTPCGGYLQPYRYMAPELLTTLQTERGAMASQYQYGTNVDSYSWAMICFELFTLSTPFASMKRGQHLTRVCLRKPSLRPHLEVYQLPKALERLLQRAWRQDPMERLSTAQIDKKLQYILQNQLHNTQSSGINEPGTST